MASAMLEEGMKKKMQEEYREDISLEISLETPESAYSLPDEILSFENSGMFRYYLL